MTTVSHIEEKKPKKYRIIDRATQAKIIEESKNMSQRDLSKQYEIPKSTLQHWIDRHNLLKGKVDPIVVIFFESSSGQAWLHRMVINLILFFHQNGNSGLPNVSGYLESIQLNTFIGTSVAALQKVAKIMSTQTMVYGKEEVARLAETMPHKYIPGALDENFIMDSMTLILMDPISGYILAEQVEEKRDAETWLRVTLLAIKGLNVTIQQLVGDEAGGLTKLATRSLGVIKGSDLFHIQQEITKGLTAPLARNLQQLINKNEELQKEKQELLPKYQEQLNKVGKLEDLSKKSIKVGKRINEIEKEELSNQKELEKTANQLIEAKETRRGITHAYHPFDLNTGEKTTPEGIKIKLEQSYETLERIANEAGCTDKQKQKLEKSKGSLSNLISVLTFFFSYLALTVRSLGLDKASEKLFEKLTSIEYLKICLKKSDQKNEKETIKKTLEKIVLDLEADPLWKEIGLSVREAWKVQALQCAQVFQRSSSCVEGRNGQLSLKFHAFRRVKEETLSVFTIMHNFFIKRRDGTTAAERFFGQKPRDLASWLLDKVELPRPRKRHPRKVKSRQEKIPA